MYCDVVQSCSIIIAGINPGVYSVSLACKLRHASMQHRTFISHPSLRSLCCWASLALGVQEAAALTRPGSSTVRHTRVHLL